MSVIDRWKESDYGRALLINIADGLASREVDPGTLKRFIDEVEVKVAAGMIPEAAAVTVVFESHARPAGQRYHYQQAVRDAGTDRFCSFVDLAKLQSLVRATPGLREISALRCMDAVLDDTIISEAEDAVELAEAITHHGPGSGLVLQRSGSGHILPQWFTTMRDVTSHRTPRFFAWDDDAATDVRDRLALSHVPPGTQLFAFTAPRGWRPDEVRARPLFWDAIDQRCFCHRFAPPCERGWGRALDMRSGVVSEAARPSEMVAPGVVFAPGFTCTYVGRVGSRLEPTGVWRRILGDRSLDDLAEVVRAATDGLAAC